MNKARERATVEAFLKRNGWPTSALVEWERESPDAIIEIDDLIIGVEITQISEADPRQRIAPQQWSREARRAVAAARVAFERRSAVALVVGAVFRPDWEHGKRGLQKLGEEISAIVLSSVPEGALSGRHFDRLQLKEPHPTLDWLWIGPTRQSLGGYWHALSPAKNQPTTCEDLIETVRRKEAAFDSYRATTQTVWLLVDCDLSGQGVALDVPHLPSNGFALRTGFDRVFCCGFGMWEWREVPCRPAP